MKRADSLTQSYHLKPLVTALFLSAGLSMFFYSGILFAYKLLPVSILFILGLTAFCCLAFWLIYKYERYLEVNEVFYKTIALDFKIHKSKFNKIFTRSIGPLNPYIGLLGTVSGLLFLLWAVPALIIYLMVHPAPHGKFLNIAVFIMSIGISSLYFFSNKKDYSSVLDKIFFFAGILTGPLGTISVLS